MPPGVSCPQPPAPSPPPKRPRAACASAPSLDAASPGRLRARPRPAQAPNRPGVSSRSCSLLSRPPQNHHPRPPRTPARDAIRRSRGTVRTPGPESSLPPGSLLFGARGSGSHGGIRLTYGGIRLTHGGRAPACAATLPGTPNPQILPAHDLGRGFPCCPLCLATPTRLSPPLCLRTQPHHASSGEPP